MQCKPKQESSPQWELARKRHGQTGNSLRRSFWELHTDEHSFEAVAARPFGDADALLRIGALVDGDEQLLLLLILDQLAQRQPAAERYAVQLRLVMHPRRR